MRLNEILFDYLNNLALQYSGFDTLVIFTAESLGNILIIVSMLFLILHRDRGLTDSARIRPVFRHRLKEIGLVFLSAILAWVVAKVLKEVFSSPRPFLALDDFNLLFLYGGEDAFPSGHATFFSALAVSLFRYHRRVGLFFALGAVLIGLARIIAGIHYPIDILGGYLLGGLISYFAYSVLKGIRDRYRGNLDDLLRKLK